MSGRKGMKHYRVETKQEAVRLVMEEHLTYAAVATRLEIRKSKPGYGCIERRESCLSISRLGDR